MPAPDHVARTKRLLFKIIHQFGIVKGAVSTEEDGPGRRKLQTRGYSVELFDDPVDWIGIYTESLGELAYQNNPKFKKFIADNNLGFKAYASFGKSEITERIAVLVDLVKLVWNDDMFM